MSFKRTNNFHSSLSGKTTRSDSRFRVIHFGKQGECIAEIGLVEPKPRGKYLIFVSLSLPCSGLPGIKQVSQAPALLIIKGFSQENNGPH